MTARWWSVSLVLALVAGGCTSSGSMPKTYPVNGTVVAKGGRSLVGASIQFAPVNDTTFSASGTLKDDGSFTLATVKGNEKASGAPEGEYRVTILFPIPADQRPCRR